MSGLFEKPREPKESGSLPDVGFWESLLPSGDGTQESQDPGEKTLKTGDRRGSSKALSGTGLWHDLQLDLDHGILSLDLSRRLHPGGRLTGVGKEG